MKQKSRWAVLPVLLLILTVQLFFAFQKEGYHMDEVLSYELANSEFTPWITPTQPEGRLEKFYQAEIRGESFGSTVSNLFSVAGDVLKNRGASKALHYTADVYSEPVWLTGDQFRAYVTYDREDSVPLLSAYYNSTTDNHPPLYFMSINLFSMFAGGAFGPWPGMILNLLFLLGTCLVILKLFTDVYRNRTAGILAMLLYGLSMAAVASVLWIRMYTMLTFFCTWALYLCLKKLRESDNGQEEGFLRQNQPLIAAMILGFWTQYFFCIYMIFLALGVLIALGIKKRYRQILFFLRSIVIAAVIALVGYPTAVKDVLHSGRGVEVWEKVSGGFSEFGLRLTTFGAILLRECFGVQNEGNTWYRVSSLMLLLVLCLAGVALRLYKNKDRKNGLPKENKEAFRGSRRLILIPLAVLAGYFLTVAKIAPYLADRYMMPVMPLTAVLWAGLMCGTDAQRDPAVYDGTGEEQKNRRNRWKTGCLAVAVLLLTVPALLLTRPPYLYTGYSEQVAVAEENNKLPCLCMYDGYGYYRNVPELMHYSQSLLLREAELYDRMEDETLETTDSLMVICGIGVDEEKVLDHLDRHYGFTEKEEVLPEGVMGDRIYRLKRTK